MKAENIKYYPKSYAMSEELKDFFTKITNDPKLQEQLYVTKKLSDVAIIANKLGCNVKGAEILQAQAGRVLAILEEQSSDVENLVSGIKPKTGAQWGRGGGGFLDRAGYWLNELSSITAITDTEKIINRFLDRAHQDAELKNKLLNAKTFNDLARLAEASGFDLSPVDLLSHQAKKILALDNDNAERMADS